MAIYFILGCLAFLVLIVLMTLAILIPMTSDVSTSTKIVNHFRSTEDSCDLDELIAYSRNNTVDYQID